jgi:chromate transporter
MGYRTGLKNLYEIFITFFRIGAFTFGGGYAMIPLIQREVVDKKKWIKEEEIIDVFAVSESMPGAIAINSSILIGYKINGKKGACAAALGVILPSFIIITLIATFFSKFQENPFVKAAFKGIRPAVVALISIAAVKIGKAAIKDKVSALITTAAFILVIVFDVHAIFAIVGGAVAGVALCKVFPNRLNDNDDKGVSKNDIH